MAFKRLVQIGRVALVSYGPHVNKVCVVTEILDAHRVIVGFEDAQRAVMSLRRIKPTDITVAVPRGARSKTLKKVFADTKCFEKFHQSSWGQKLASHLAKREMTDFDRYVAMRERRDRARRGNLRYNQMKA